MRCGGKVGEGLGIGTGVGVRGPEGTGPGVPEGVGLGVGAGVELGAAEPGFPLAGAPDPEIAVAGAGGGVPTDSRSATANRYVLVFSAEL